MVKAGIYRDGEILYVVVTDKYCSTYLVEETLMQVAITLGHHAEEGHEPETDKICSHKFRAGC